MHPIGTPFLVKTLCILKSFKEYPLFTPFLYTKYSPNGFRFNSIFSPLKLIIVALLLKVNRQFSSMINFLGVNRMKISFGEKIRNLREDKDLNQTQLGQAVCMTQRKISFIECGKYEPSLDDIVAFCRFFGVSADYLLGLTEE